MADSNMTASASVRKLLEGELVEVRQKEKGLRGSWHSGVVVRVKFSRRVVEYDELFTLDGLKKLTEVIPIYENVKFQTSVLREKNATETPQNNRGYIRPIPPRCDLPFPQSWTKGLLVDAFYEDAWWEGILLEDVLSDNANAKVRILFPDEGDEMRILVKNVRVSQEWDEATGLWAVSGLWSDETVDFSSLKQICRQTRGVWKDLWRQRRCNVTKDWWSVERTKSFLAPTFENNMIACTRITGVQKGGKVDLDTAKLKNADALEKRKMPLSSKAQRLESHCEGTDNMCGTGQVPIAQNDSSFLVVSTNKEQCLAENGKHKLRTNLPDQSKSTIGGGVCLADAPHVLSTSGDKKRKLILTASQAGVSLKTRGCESDAKYSGNFSEQDSGKSPQEHKFAPSKEQGCSISRKTVSSRLKGIDKAAVRLTRSTKVLDAPHNGNSKHLWPSRPLKLKLQQATAANNQSVGVEGSGTEGLFGAEGEVDGGQTENGKDNPHLNSVSDKLCSEHTPCQQGRRKVPINVHSDGRAFLPRKANSIPSQARLSAKRFLLDNGWHVQFQVHPNSGRQSAIYVSPSGVKCSTLVKACREEIKDLNLSNSSGDNARVELGFESIYNIAKGFGCPQNKSSNVSCSVVEDKAHSLLQNGLGISCQKRSHSTVQQVEGINSPSLVFDSSPQELGHNHSQLAICGGKTGKRKPNGKDSDYLPEPRCKKNKSSLRRAEFVHDKVSRAGCRMQVLLSLPAQVEANSGLQQAEPSHFKRSTVLSWLIDKGVLKENESVAYLSRKNGHSVKRGQVTREGVRCNCCKVVFTLSNFEAHAGSKLHRPSANIFLNDGRSISDCQMQACELHDAKEKEGLMDRSDDTCGVCGDGGELILCDHCPSTFHPDCIGLRVIPEGDWYCPRCCCGECGGNQLAGIADARMHRCAQCELEYHHTCVLEPGVIKSDRVSRKPWFCRPKCEEIFTALRGLVGIAHPIEKGLSWVILRSMNRDHGITPSSLEVMAEYNSKLSVAHGVMQECFVPMIDPRTKINLISQALYNRRSKVTRLDYSGFYTMLLESGDEIISVATIRIHGAKLAEMPLVGTRFQYRRQGMCRRLVHALEEMLRNIGVEKLILPAVPELLDTWKGSFRFQEMNFSERCELIKLNLMSFPGTTLLQKHLVADAHVKELRCQIAVSEKINHNRASFDREKDSKYTTSAQNLTACIADKSDHSVEGNTCNRIPIMERNEQLIHKLDSGVGKANQLCGESQPNLQDANCSPAAVETTEGQVKFSLTKGPLKGRIKCKPLAERVGDALELREENRDGDIYNTKVVLTTTRSKRLVKSCRWVVDGLKELAKDAKQPKRALCLESSVPKSVEGTENLKYTYLVEECSQREEGKGNGQTVENVYVRMRRRATPHLVQVDDSTEPPRALDFSCNECASEPAAESILSESGKHSDDETVSTVTNRPLICSPLSDYSDVGRDIRQESVVVDEALNNTNILGARFDANLSSSDLRKYSNGSMQGAENGLTMGTKYYIRRKKMDRHEDSNVITAKEGMKATTLENAKPSACAQLSSCDETQESKTDVVLSQTHCEVQLGKPAAHVLKPTPSLCAITSLIPVAVERQGVRG